MNIRLTEEGDWSALKAIRLEALRDAPTAFGVSYATAAAYTDEQWRNRASAQTQPEFVLAFVDGKVVGMAGGGVDQRGRFNLIGMWVQPEYRGQGVAGPLVDAVKARAIAQGHQRVILDVAPENARAASFYQRQGFVFLPEWEPLASHPEIQVQTMEWRALAGSKLEKQDGI